MRVLRSAFLLSVFALGLLSLSLFWIGPILQKNYSEFVGNFFYVLIRCVVIVGLSFSFSRWTGKVRFQSIALTTFVIFLDQAVLKTLWLAGTVEPRPSGMGEWGPILLTQAMSYFVALPLVVGLSFMGAMLAQALTLRRSS